ncbi:ER membrane protein complex subunit 3-like [Armigeres subalbatus]|uniref:ER membrane protein complex subunit 3-like n=1 Tax=Armigeres subalbatus TaxID=124917 RepID=UPI002ECFB371
MRRHYFNNEKLDSPCPNWTAMLSDIVKGNFINVLPIIVIGGSIGYFWAGDDDGSIPVDAALQAAIVQLGIELVWVSSASWYFLNVFGLRS